jgi:hypothetical protein
MTRSALRRPKSHGSQPKTTIRHRCASSGDAWGTSRSVKQRFATHKMDAAFIPNRSSKRGVKLLIDSVPRLESASLVHAIGPERDWRLGILQPRGIALATCEMNTCSQKYANTPDAQVCRND